MGNCGRESKSPSYKEQGNIDAGGRPGCEGVDRSKAVSDPAF